MSGNLLKIAIIIILVYIAIQLVNIKRIQLASLVQKDVVAGNLIKTPIYEQVYTKTAEVAQSFGQEAVGIFGGVRKGISVM